jgi:SEC-C motif-containing protein
MRARYSAYVEGEDDFLIESWHSLSCPAQIGTVLNQRWLGLKILVVDQGRPEDGRGSVEFVATFKVSGKVETLHEVSEFVREQGRWRYLSGTLK